MRKPTLQYAVLGILLLWALLAQLTFIGFIIYIQANEAHDLPVPFTTSMTRIIQIAPSYGNSGLKIGDDIIALNGQPMKGVKQLDDLRFALHPGSTLVVTVRRTVDGGSQTVAIPIRMHAYRSQSFDWTALLTLRVFLPLSCILVGFYITFARPRDPLAWITLGMLASFAELLGRESLWAIWSPWRELLIIYFSLLNSVWPLWLVLFALYFPVPFPFLRKRPWIGWMIAVPFLFLAALNLYGDLMEGNHARQLLGLTQLGTRLDNPVHILVSAYISGFFFSLGFKQRVANTSDSRRRLRVMMTGCSLALTPLLVVVLAQLKIIPPLPDWATTTCFVMLVFFPITMAYVIVVQRAMDVRMVIRSGARYAMASTGLRIARILLLTGIVALTVHLGTQSGHLWQAIVISCLGTALAIGFRRVAMRANHWMDRRFFREAYKAEAILTELSNSVAGIRDTKALLQTVTHRIADSLHVPRIAVLLEQGNIYQPAYALGFNGHAPSVEFKPETATVRLLKRERAPSKIYFDDPQSWVHGTSETERTALRALDAQLLLPVSLKTRMLGIIALGPKRSEAPYSKADLQLLSAVASQTGLALENAELTETIRQEVAERERANRELEIAREVQQRLFPQTLPQVESLDFAGYCRPALGVGGDYYDFIRLPDGALGIAVGDVSGKGIAAALLMASLQASLRAQTIRPYAKLSEMIQHINRLVYEASADNRYATFFYAQFHPEDRTLRYVNAGHNAPILLRGTSQDPQILRLEEGGTVIGLFPEYPYTEAQIQLESGDIVVAFTDGISEAMNAADEEFDEERLIEAIRKCDSSPAGEMITRILEEVDAFTGGARQHDDMTLVTARVE